ncbi:MAG: hypothetical protein KQH59_03570 [Desulfobulbaceae bacterium]|nr:hypothetical protein [Desulfobulbaceae bacterium]
MKTVQELHNKSMDNAEKALLHRMNGNEKEANKLFQKALFYEKQAIILLEKERIVEPTFSILHRSAATLALDCNAIREAEQLVTKALSFEPPYEIAEELRDLLEQIYFKRHLELRGVSLEDDELQMSLAGRGVGYGIVESKEFLTRIEGASKIVYRIAERRQKKPYRDSGGLKKGFKQNYEVFLSVPRAASFAVTLKIGKPKDQQDLPGFTGTKEIIDEFLFLMNALEESRVEDIRNKIQDEAYFTNFINLSKKIAPDGENISMVGFTSKRGREVKPTTMTKSRKEIVRIATTTEISSTHIAEALTPVEVKGYLRFADATSEKKGLIKVVNEETQESFDIKVPEGMMEDIVKPMWNSFVIVNGLQTGRYIILGDIIEAKEIDFNPDEYR